MFIRSQDVRLLVVFAAGRGVTGFLLFLYPTSTKPKEDPLQRCLSQAETKCGQKEVDRGPRANREALYLAPQRGSWEQSIRSFLEHSPAVVSEVGRVAGVAGWTAVDGLLFGAFWISWRNISP